MCVFIYSQVTWDTHQVRPVSPEQAELGQYRDYAAHVLADHPGLLFSVLAIITKTKHNIFLGSNTTSTTPTRSAAVVFVDNERWRDVPFVLSAGKQLAERRAHVVVHFKPDSLACPASGCHHASLRFQLHVCYY